MDPDAAYAVAVRLLARHWHEHPHSCDCEEGIEKWWIGSSANVTRAQLRAALQWLEKRGAVESLRAGDGRVRYRRRADFDTEVLRRMAADP